MIHWCVLGRCWQFSQYCSWSKMCDLLLWFHFIICQLIPWTVNKQPVRKPTACSDRNSTNTVQNSNDRMTHGIQMDTRILWNQRKLMRCWICKEKSNRMTLLYTLLKETWKPWLSIRWKKDSESRREEGEGRERWWYKKRGEGNIQAMVWSCRIK